MFGLARRVKALEEKMKRLERDKDCAKGNHVWELYISNYDNQPNVRCAFCYKHAAAKIAGCVSALPLHSEIY